MNWVDHTLRLSTNYRAETCHKSAQLVRKPHLLPSTEAIHAGYVRSCHDLSEGGLAVAAAEMAFAGGVGARLYLLEVPHEIRPDETSEVPGDMASILLFAESNSRFLVEVTPDNVGHFEMAMGDVPHAAVGEVIADQNS